MRTATDLLLNQVSFSRFIGPIGAHIRLAVLAASLAFLQLGCGNSHTYHAQALDAIKVTLPLLQKYGVCASDLDCQQKEVILFQAGDAVRINIYRFPNSTELRQKIAKELCRLKERNAKVSYVLTTYANAHGEKTTNRAEFKIEGVC